MSSRSIPRSKYTSVVACLTLVEALFESLDTGYNRLLSWTDADDFNFVVDLTIPCSIRPVATVPRPLIEKTSSIGIMKWLVEVTNWLWNVIIHSFDEFHNSVFVSCIAFESLCSRTLDDWAVTVEAVLSLAVHGFLLRRARRGRHLRGPSCS
jgi:hypothetical protein